MRKIGIRYEDKYLMERRVALVPDHVKQLVDDGVEIEVVRSEKRIFKDEEFETVGAQLVNEVTDSDIVIGVKEMPIGYFKKNRTYIFFSHTIKGQQYNMPLLQDMINSGASLIDYEKIEDEQGRRLIFFGRFAGLAGMINSLWALGQRWQNMGIDTPFLKIKQTHHYNSLEEAKEIIQEVGNYIRENGLPENVAPLTIGITGYGNVSKGAQEILDLLSVIEVSTDELLTLKNRKDISNKVIYKTVFKEEHLSKPIEVSKKFELQEYYDHPELFESQFEKYIPHMTVLMNCMYWDDRYPRIVTKDYLEKLYKVRNPKLTVIGDVTCDPDGSIEALHKGTEIEDPVFVYNPFTRQATMGFEGEGLLIMGVDILPSELPREASQTFSNALIGFLPEIVNANFDMSFENLKLPSPIKKAMIVFKGKLTPDYEYLNEHLK
ncbi:MAG: bifunctional lysine ketoglutarate reductase /saccharopine dehydrogenase family protein [Bacteroidales bacterium]|jgi:alpha-aminoadipic semialdehyde synthase|nr:bifunctional lysine ketoglutarate reductase /saccharopine dehydrogenase family protein [Bacteroidales bacterium]